MLKTIETENDRIRFAIYLREDGLLSVDEERLKDGDEYTGPYWSFDQLGLFGSREDVRQYLATVSPKPKESLPD